MKRAAVVIGVNSTGGLPVLDSAAPGAKEVAHWLRDEGFEVVCLTDETDPVTHIAVRDAVFRFVNSHPEAWGPEALRIGEVTELFAAQDAITAQTGALPTVYAGDYNSKAPLAGAYQLLTSRLTDLWLASHPAGPDPNPGSVTCCFGAFLDDPTNTLETRIDLLLGTAGVRALSSYRIGDRPVDLPGDVWWASDHAGVVAKVVIGR